MDGGKNGWGVNIQKDDMAFGLAFLLGWVTKRMCMRYKECPKAALSIHSS